MKSLTFLLLLVLASAAAIAAAPRQTTKTEDCIKYNPDSLQIEDAGEIGWRLVDGKIRLQTLDNREDAEAAMALAQQHTYQCFIGRDNRRPERIRYIVQYGK
jgi:hypothetical protein